MENQRIAPNTTIEFSKLYQTLSNCCQLYPIVALWKLAERHLHFWMFPGVTGSEVHDGPHGFKSWIPYWRWLESRCGVPAARAFGQLTKGEQMQWNFAQILHPITSTGTWFVLLAGYTHSRHHMRGSN